MSVQSINLNVGASLVLARKITFEASMERAIMQKKYWDELLEKLRKSGGGGSSDKRFDRIAVSMMLSNFLRNKIIEAMIKNLNLGFAQIFKSIDVKIPFNINVIFANVQKTGTSFINMLLIVGRDMLQHVSTGHITKPISNILFGIIGIMSFQLNKLKDILEEDLKEFLKKLDVKGKMKKIKTMLSDFCVEMKEEIFGIIKFAGFYVEKYLLPSINTGTPRITQ